MEILIISLTSLFASGLTLFSGFGLGTILMPVFAIFFPVDIAVALTAIVHFLNNIFKLILLGKHADKNVVIKFGVPAIISAFLGAYLLIKLSEIPPLFTYYFLNKENEIHLIKIIISVLMIGFAFFEIIPKYQNLSFDKKYLPLGGILSGFFGGISGHQGALRSAFLIKLNLTKETFIATGVVIAVLIDITRISIYSSHFTSGIINENLILLIAAVISAFAGAFIGNKLIKKITIRTIQLIVAALLFVIAILLGFGII